MNATTSSLVYFIYKYISTRFDTDILFSTALKAFLAHLIIAINKNN